MLAVGYIDDILLLHCASYLMLSAHFWSLHLSQKMINGMTVSRWACINFSRSVQENVARGFCSELARMCQVSGMVG